jgi:hypothetical protein
MLKVPDFEKDFEIHSDAFNLAIQGVLVQGGRSVAFESKKLNEMERRSPTHARKCGRSYIVSRLGAIT